MLQDIRTFYQEQGYVIVPDAFTADEIAALRQEALSICRGECGPVQGAPEILPGDSDDDIMRRILCIHFPHKLSPLMVETMKHPAIVNTLTQVIGPNVKCMQSMLFVKSAGKPGQAWHQDEDFIPTRDRSLCGAWIALDDATIENGCLWIIPGSHKPGILWELQPQTDPAFDCADRSVGFPYTDEDAIPVEVKAGSVVFFNGYTLHQSQKNVAKHGYRRALVYHYMSAESLLPWRRISDGEWFSTLDFRDIIMVAGEDPYAWKGLENKMEPHIRPEREGGCKWFDPNAELVGEDED
jgi:ectoine hydroxylase-related dioxygenase (phytanoyl-CoA dioxygenase family)